MQSLYSKAHRRVRYVISAIPRRRKKIYDTSGPAFPLDKPTVDGDLYHEQPLELLKTVGDTLDRGGIPWFVAGDLLLEWYGVPLVVGDYEICVPESLKLKAEELITSHLKEFCVPWPSREFFGKEQLWGTKRYKINKYVMAFNIVSHTVYGLDDSFPWTQSILRPPVTDFPVLALPLYIAGIVQRMMKLEDSRNGAYFLPFRMELGSLIDGMDLDEDWCDHYLESEVNVLVKALSTREAKRKRYGTHPKYRGNLTTFIRNQEEQSIRLGTPGRTPETATRTE